jgi:16S rRNA (cytosine967-C5)-methyltransferase
MKISPARTAAFDALLKIERDRAFSSVLLQVYENGLSAPDRALCHELVLGVLRRQIWLDRLIDRLAEKRKLDLEIRIALRLGIFQLLYLDKIPDHAAVNESVNLAVRARKSSAKSFANAILRKSRSVSRELITTNEIERISAETSHPQWLIEKWIGQFGVESAEQIAAANNVPAPLAFRRTLKGKNTIFENEYRKSEFVAGCFMAHLFSGDLRSLVQEGEIYFQDEASQMVAAAVDVSSEGKFLDVCAAPGGKTGAIAARLGPSQMVKKRLFVAGDLYHQRIVFLRDNLVNQGIDYIDVVEYDAAEELPFADETFDTVLVDAPCSGTGTIRHNPEIRYFLGPSDFGELQKTQLEILRNASKVLKPGGTLVYSTCSLEREENEDVCRQFLAAASEFRTVKPNVPEKFVADEGFARTFPHRDGMDGFFIAQFARPETDGK